MRNDDSPPNEAFPTWPYDWMRSASLIVLWLSSMRCHENVLRDSIRVRCAVQRMWTVAHMRLSCMLQCINEAAGGQRSAVLNVYDCHILLHDLRQNIWVSCVLCIPLSTSI